MEKVFISYSKDEEEFAFSLSEFLKQNKVKVWIACENLYGGDNFYEHISSALEWCDVFILSLINR